jgi:hypothetical protein
VKLPTVSELLQKYTRDRKTAHQRLHSAAGLLFCVALALTAAFPAVSVAQQTGKPVVVLIGPPGSGKSTQAERIQQHYRFAVITREQLMQDDPSLLRASNSPIFKASSRAPIPPSISSSSNASNKPTSARGCCSTATRRPKTTLTSSVKSSPKKASRSL